MNTHRLVGTFAVGIAIAIAPAFSASAAEQARTERANRLSFSYRLGFDISAKFDTVQPLSRVLREIPTTGHQVVRNYDVGGTFETYVRVDINGNEYIDPETGQIIYATWNWGVSSLDQINSDDGTVRMSTPTELHLQESELEENEITHGFEIIYNRRLSALGKGSLGLEAAFAFDQVELRTSGAAHLYRTWITDTYRFLGGAPDVFVVPPQGSYEAPPSGWPLLAAVPNPGSRQTSVETVANAVNGRYRFDANLFGFRLGPYAEWPLGGKFSFLLNGGLALLLVDSQFDYQETVNGYPELSSARQGEDGDLLVGGYVNGRVTYFLSDKVNMFVGAQWQGMSRYKQRLGSKEARVDVGGRPFFSVGIGFSF